MKAVVKTRLEPGNVELIDVPDPKAGPGQVVIEVHNAGVCGTDIHIFKSEYVIKPPVILGHELCGTVAAVGPGVTRLKVGDRVTVNPSAGKLCGHCRYCQIGAPFFCIDRAAVGSGMNGGFAKYCCVRQEIVFPLPDNLDFETGALCEPFACALQAVIELTTIKPADVVAVSGPGPIGLMCAMLAKLHGRGSFCWEPPTMPAAWRSAGASVSTIPSTSPTRTPRKSSPTSRTATEPTW